jgi:Zn-dependent protease with chaperone function
MTTGSGLYFDGATSARHAVTVECGNDTLRISAADGAILAEWPTSGLHAMPASDRVLRLASAGAPELARLEVVDPALIAEIQRRAGKLDRKAVAEHRLRRRVILWSLIATASLVLAAIFGLPLLSDRIAPLIPLTVENRLGLAIDAQVRSLLDTEKTGKPFECGSADTEKPGRAALGALMGRLEQAAGLPVPLKAAVVRRREANAIALPGGHIYVFAGLVARSRNPDELAAVLAHEIGHVARRDGTRSLLEAAGLSFLFGVLLGDFAGGGLVVVAARAVVHSAYSREVEGAADLYGVRLMANAGGDPRALGAVLDRVSGSLEQTGSVVADHPQTKARTAAIEAAAAALSAPLRPLLTPPEWAALKHICE